MKPPKPRIYLDTSVISYHAARLNRDPAIRFRQHVTRYWWELAKLCSQELCVSSYVLEEAAKGDVAAARHRLGLVADIHVLTPDPASEMLSQRLQVELGLPARSRLDACRLAIAAWNGVDYIVSWNFKHMANSTVSRIYRRICLDEGLAAPDIRTPWDLLKHGRTG